MLASGSGGKSTPFPPATSRRVIVGVITALLGVAATTAALLSLLDAPDWWRGLRAAGVVSALATALSLVPLIWGLRTSLNAAMIGYFLAMGVRAIVSLAGCLLLIKAGNYPSTPTLLLMAVFYVAVLATEAVIVGLAAWSTGESVQKTDVGPENL